MISESKIIDLHTHIFPEKLASRAVSNIGNYYSLNMQGDGTVTSLCETRKNLPNYYPVISSATLKAESMVNGNNYLLDCAAENKNVSAFTSFYPFLDLKSAEEEIKRCVSRGSIGIKLHPDFQHFNIDDSHVIEIYKICIDMDLPILFHVGDRNTDFSTPQRVYNLAEKLPDLKIIAAHLCGYSVWDEAEKILIGTDVYTEISDADYGLDGNQIVDMVRRHGVDKVMFGSDFPLNIPEKEFEKFEKLSFTNEEREKILHINAEKLLFGKK